MQPVTGFGGEQPPVDLSSIVLLPNQTLESSSLGERVQSVATKQLEVERKGPSRYDRQVIINLGRGVTAAALQRKAEMKNPPLQTEIISYERWKASPNPSEFLQHLTPLSRVYCIGCGAPGAHVISGDKQGEQLAVQELVQALSKIPALTQPNVRESSRCLKISVVAGFGASSAQGSPSFVHRLSRELSKLNVQAEVRGFTVLVRRCSSNTLIPVHKLSGTCSASKQPHTKLAVWTVNGKTFERDVYTEKCT